MMNESLELLARSGRELAGSLDYRDTLNRVATMVTTTGFADWCGVYLTSPAGRFDRAWVRHRDPAMDMFVQDYLGRPPRSNVLAELSPALVEGRSALHPRVDEATLTAWAQDEEHLTALRTLRIGSLAAVPLQVQERVVGALTFVRVEPVAVPFGAQDLIVAEEIGRQAGWAIENARLHARVAEHNRQMKGILGIVAHDLRNPLNTALGALQNLMDGVMEKETACDIASRHLHRMDSLVGDLLDSVRADAGEAIAIQQTEVQLDEVLREVTESQAVKVREKGMRWSVHIPEDLPRLWADRARLIQLLVNICGNATKFTPARGDVAVRAERLGQRVRISVKDTGPGIPLELQPRVFDLFWQAPDTAHQGTGLGLSIARRLAEAHGGGITLDSRPGEGAEFAVTIPLASTGLVEG